MIWEKIDISSIIKDHIHTLSNFDPERELNEQKISGSDIFLFFIVPAIVSGTFIILQVHLSEGIINILIASLSIFVGLLLNLLVILMGLLDKSKEKAITLKSGNTEMQNQLLINAINKKIQLLKETYSNISFSVVVAFISIPIFLIALVKNQCLLIMANFVGYYFLFVFTFTIFMVLKRVHLLLSSDASE